MFEFDEQKVFSFADVVVVKKAFLLLCDFFLEMKGNKKSFPFH